jgi:hypothetical protein
MTLLSFAWDNRALIVLPVLGLVVAAGLPGLKRSYIDEGHLFPQSRMPRTSDEPINHTAVDFSH